METATHFVNNNSCVYSCFLDASKAFDKVRYGKLFNLMLKRGVPSSIVRFILGGYIRHRMCAQWERHTSINITLLSPSLPGLQYMVNICEEYGKEFHVSFNDNKTTGMVFGASNSNCKAIQVNGNNVDWVTNARHLGNVVDNKLSDLKDINAKRSFYCEFGWSQ